MLRSLALLLALALTGLALVMTGCSSGSSGGDSLALLQGTVLNGTGTAVPGATVKVGAVTDTTDADGKYDLFVAPGANLKVEASKAGLVETFDMVSLSAGQNFVINFTMLPVGNTNALVNMLANQTVANDARGGTVTLPANTIVDSDGAAVDNATVDITTVLPTDANYTENFPGLFIGTQGGVDTAIESFGYTTIDITSGGKSCNLKAGATAEIAIPVALGADPGTPTIELWSLDEETGKWIYEGPATRDTTGATIVYRATVSHFSAYNLDRPIANALPLVVTVKNSTGATVAGVSVEATSTGAAGSKWEGRGTTGPNGTYEFTSVPPGSISVQAIMGTLTGSAYGYDIVAGKAVMEITLIATVQKTFTVVYDNNGVETPAANVAVQVISEGVGAAGHSFANGTTNANGQVTLNLKDGLNYYMYSCNPVINLAAYSLNGNANSLATIPAKWVLVKL